MLCCMIKWDIAASSLKPETRWNLASAALSIFSTGFTMHLKSHFEKNITSSSLPEELHHHFPAK